MNEKNVFDKFTELMDRNIRGVQYGVYAVAGIGLFVALRSVRPFSKFCKASDIPSSFIKKRMKFYGTVMSVTGGNNPLLRIDHHPLIALPILTKQGDGLPVQVSSVDVTPNGGIWLGTLLQGSEISFIPLRANNGVVQCIVNREKQDVGYRLVSIGFASVGAWDFKLDKDTIYAKYYKALLSAEKRAERAGAGMWQDQPSRTFADIVNQVRSFRFSFT